MALRDYKLSMVASVDQGIELSGSDFLGFLEGTDYLWVSIDNGPYVKRRPGDMQKGDYSRVRFLSDIDQTVIIVAGSGNFTTANQSITVNATATVQGGNSNPALADVVIPAGGSATIAAANATRKGVLIRALNSNDVSVFIRVGVGAAAAQGAELGAGEALPLLETEGKIDAYNPGAVPFTVSVMEINRI